ncbi:MAG: 5-formyltetrahydrofolate cyclo-ligase [Verrucomicrobiota bacterium]
MTERQSFDIRHSEGGVVVSGTESKAVLRARVRAARRALSPAAVDAASRKIAELVISLPEFSRARAVGCYLALPHEVQTADLIARCRRAGKKTCVPAFDAAARGYVWAWLDEEEPVVKGPSGIPQPETVRKALPADLDLMMVPAVAFDRTGRRLGHGGGHYDRLLARCPGFKVGVAFEVQVVEEVPSRPHDVAVDVVVTERCVYPLRG